MCDNEFVLFADDALEKLEHAGRELGESAAERAACALGVAAAELIRQARDLVAPDEP